MSEDLNFMNSFFSAPASPAAREECTDKIMPPIPPDATVTMAYIPFQQMGETYDEETALRCGTLFPELNKPFYGKCVY